MASSAIRSSSAGVTPMATASPARRSARADTRPASRMISISAGDLRTIMRRSALKDVAHVHEDSVHGTVAVDRAQQPLGRVVGDQGRGVLVIDVQTVGDRRDGVVVALIDLASTVVAYALDCGHVAHDVVDVAARAALAPRGQASSMKPSAQSGWLSLSRTIPMTTASGTSPPLSMKPLAATPMGVAAKG